MAAKFRGNTTKLHIEDIRSIRRRLAGVRVRGLAVQIAMEYGVAKSTVNRIARGIQFRFVDSLVNQDEQFIAGTDLSRPDPMDGSQLKTIALNSFADISGQTFTRLTVLFYEGPSGNGEHKWRCICSCGSEKTAIGSRLRMGRVKSCGCLINESRRRSR